MFSSQSLAQSLAHLIAKIIGVSPPEIVTDLPDWVDRWKHATVTVTSNPLDEPFVRDYFRYKTTQRKADRYGTAALVFLIVGVITGVYIGMNYGIWVGIGIGAIFLCVVVRFFNEWRSIRSLLDGVDEVASNVSTELDELIKDEMSVRLNGPEAVLDYPHWSMISPNDSPESMTKFFDTWDRAQSLSGESNMKSADTWIETVRLFCTADEECYKAWNAADMPEKDKRTLRRLMKTAELAKNAGGAEGDSASTTAGRYINDLPHNSRFSWEKK